MHQRNFLKESNKNLIDCVLYPLVVCNTLGDIVFVIDSSGSINDRDPGNWDRMKSFTKNIVNRLQVGPFDAQIGIVKYSTKAYIEFPLDSYLTNNEVNRAIDNMRYLGGNTNTSGGLWLMREEVSFMSFSLIVDIFGRKWK